MLIRIYLATLIVILSACHNPPRPISRHEAGAPELENEKIAAGDCLLITNRGAELKITVHPDGAIVVFGRQIHLAGLTCAEAARKIDETLQPPPMTGRSLTIRKCP